MNRFFTNLCKDDLDIEDHEELKIESISVLQVNQMYEEITTLMLFELNKESRSYIRRFNSRDLKDSVLILLFPDGFERKVSVEEGKLKMKII